MKTRDLLDVKINMAIPPVSGEFYIPSTDPTCVMVSIVFAGGVRVTSVDGSVEFYIKSAILESDVPEDKIIDLYAGHIEGSSVTIERLQTKNDGVTRHLIKAVDDTGIPTGYHPIPKRMFVDYCKFIDGYTPSRITGRIIIQELGNILVKHDNKFRGIKNKSLIEMKKRMAECLVTRHLPPVEMG